MKLFGFIIFLFLFFTLDQHNLHGNEIDKLNSIKNDLEHLFQSNNVGIAARARSSALELTAELKNFGMKIDENQIKNLESNEPQIFLSEVNNLISLIEQKQGNTQLTQDERYHSLFYIGLTFVLLIALFVRHQSRPSVNHDKKLSASLSFHNREFPELLGISFILGPRGQFIKYSEKAEALFKHFEFKNFDDFYKKNIVHVHVSQAGNLIKIDNIEELKDNYFYYRAKSFIVKNRSYRYVKFMQVRELSHQKSEKAPQENKI